ncbi:unnamed protein product [Prunus brigantina]
MRHDSTEYVKKCDRCQRYKPVPNLPAEVYHQQNSPWPFIFTCETLAYGTKAIIPTHITVPTISLEVGSVDQNSE